MKFSKISLLQWYKNHGRHNLPWRNTADIYHIYLSEVMLQQTQVSRVKEEYYPKFLIKYPTIKDLAKASLDEVLADWSGLGYYRRAENLYKCAKTVSYELPKTQKELVKLPGIGRYTASAICSFALGQSIPVVDTNIARVLKRFFALKSPKESEIWGKAEEFLNRQEPKKHNLALMDLGAMVCLPKNPKCDECPLLTKCIGNKSPEKYSQTKKTEYESLDLFYGVLIKNGEIALTPATGNMYRGMLELPSVDPQEDRFLGKFKHSYTKYRLTVYLYEIEEYSKEVVWVDLKSINSKPISNLVKKAIGVLNL